MALRTLLIVVLVGLTAVVVFAQARTEPAGAGPKPAMIVAGRALTPAAFADGLQGDTVTLDGVDMLWVGAAAKAGGGSARIEVTPEGKMLHVRAGTRTLEFVVLPPGEFWRHPWVRDLIAGNSVYELQPLPYRPYEEANIPAHAPHGVNWKRPYLDWKPDEAWLLLNLEPPPPEEPEIRAVTEDEEEEDEEAKETTVRRAPTTPPAGEMGMPMGGPPAGGMEPGMAPPPGGPEGDPGMLLEPPPLPPG